VHQEQRRTGAALDDVDAPTADIDEASRYVGGTFAQVLALAQRGQRVEGGRVGAAGDRRAGEQNREAGQRLPEPRRRLRARPIRPATNWKGDNDLGEDPAGARVRHRPVDARAHAQFAASIRELPPERR
jgi:hypothetical protein